MLLCNDIVVIQYDKRRSGLPSVSVVIEHDKNRT